MLRNLALLLGVIISGLWTVLIPQATTNIITNPSFETNTTGWNANGGASITRWSAQQYFGAWSLAITMSAGLSDGTFFDHFSLTSGQTYVGSAYVKGGNVVPYAIAFYTTGGVQKAITTFTGTGVWQRVSVTWTADATTTYRLYILKNNTADTNAVIVDGVQVEQQSTVTTFCDGDQDGCTWNGVPHASTSKRDAQSRAGGVETNLDTYNLFVENPAGIGMVPVHNVATPYALLGGAQYQRTVAQPRRFFLNSYSVGTTLADLHAQRQAFLDAINPWGYNTQQAVQFRYAGNTRKVLVDAYYAGGAEYDRKPQQDGFNTKNALAFDVFLPNVREEGQAGASLNVLNAVTNANFIVQRDNTGVWSNLGTGADAAGVNAITVLPTGDVVAAGSFGTMGGVANTTGIARWDGASWNAMGTGINIGAQVTALAVGPDGSLYVGGSFTTMGGVAGTARIAKWNGTVWSALTTGANNGTVQALTFDSTGNLYAGGDFTQMSAAANTARIAKWNGSTWSALGTGAADNTVFALAGDKAGNVYAGGNFSTMGGVAGTKIIAKWNGSTWSALGSGIASSSVLALALTPDGLLYAGGNFSTAGGIPASNIAKWNGAGWSALGAGVNNTVQTLLATPWNLIAAGNFTQAGGVPISSTSIAIWQSNQFIPSGAALPGGSNIHAVAYSVKSGNFYIGWDSAGTVNASQTTITNTSTDDTFPVFTIKGPTSGTGAVYYLWNWTTHQVIWFNNLNLIAGETATLDLRQGHKTFTSDFRGNLLPYVVPGSDMNWRLLPGTNVVSLLCSDATMTATAWWLVTHKSADGAH